MAKFQFWLPTLNDLTRKQKRAIDSNDPIFLTGVPGTGKTVVSIYRLLNSDNALLLTYGKLLRKTIEEKINDNSKKIMNIHKWLWDITKTELDTNLNDQNILQTINNLKVSKIKYNQILVDEGQDLSPNSYKLFDAISDEVSVSADEAQMVMDKGDGAKEQDILDILPHLKVYELDEIFRSTYEMYNFARYFVPYNTRANSENLLQRLQRDNSGADKPYVYLLNDLNDTFEVMQDIIDDNPTDNIGILLPSISEVETYTKKLSDDYDVSSYHSGYSDVPEMLHNIIVTTLKSAKGIEFDIVILPQAQNITDKMNEEYFVGATRAKSELHILSIQKEPEIFDKFDKNSYKIINRLEK